MVVARRKDTGGGRTVAWKLAREVVFQAETRGRKEEEGPKRRPRLRFDQRERGQNDTSPCVLVKIERPLPDFGKNLAPKVYACLYF